MIIGKPETEASSARARARRESRIATQIAKRLPPDVKRAWVKIYHKDAEDAFRRLLRGSDHVCEHCDCSAPSHQAVRMFLEMAGAIGAPGQIIVNWLQNMNVNDEKEATRLLDSGRRFEKMTEDATADLESLREEAVSLLEDLLKEKPEWRDGIIGRLDTRAHNGHNAPHGTRAHNDQEAQDGHNGHSG